MLSKPSIRSGQDDNRFMKCEVRKDGRSGQDHRPGGVHRAQSQQVRLCCMSLA
jgi:hypothetical protein